MCFGSDTIGFLTAPALCIYLDQASRHKRSDHSIIVDINYVS